MHEQPTKKSQARLPQNLELGAKNSGDERLTLVGEAHVHRLRPFHEGDYLSRTVHGVGYLKKMTAKSVVGFGSGLKEPNLRPSTTIVQHHARQEFVGRGGIACRFVFASHILSLRFGAAGW